MYAITANATGRYPVYVWGFKEPQGTVLLQKGDVWKLGKTINPKTRYPQSFYINTGSGVSYNTIATGTEAQMLWLENRLLLKALERNGFLYPGNKMKR